MVRYRLRLNRIPGFRSGTPWKQTLAAVVYSLWLVIVIGMGVGVAQHTSPRGAYVWLLMNSVLLHALLFDVGHLRSRLPLRKSVVPQVIVWGVVFFIGSTAVGMAIPESSDYIAYEAARHAHTSATDAAVVPKQPASKPADSTAPETPAPSGTNSVDSPGTVADDSAEEAPAGANLPAPGPVSVSKEGIPCRSGDVLAGVYNPSRLTVVAPCKVITGKVTTIRHETDGDFHINVLPDAAYAGLVNQVNRDKQHGDLVVEVIPADAANVPIPHVGQQIEIVGAYVLDKQHGGWAEIHPAWRITPVNANPSANTSASPGAVTPPPPVAKPPTTSPGATGQPSAPAYPPELTAVCRDGSSSFSAHAQGTCSRHGGVAQWIHHP